MITYVNGFWGFPMLLRIHGSALWKSILPATTSTIIYTCLYSTNIAVDSPDHADDVFLHPYPMQALVTAFTFLLVFRANYSYDRWWSAYSSVYLMHAKWLDFATEVAAFHYQSKRYDQYKPPSFGANPGVQSLEMRASEILMLDDDTDGFVPTSSTGATVAVLNLTSLRKKQHGRQSSTAAAPQGLPRHANSPTYVDLIEQMNACEAKEAEMKRQILDVVDQLSDNNQSDNSMDGKINNNNEEKDEHDACDGYINSDVINEEEGDQSTSRRSWLPKIHRGRNLQNKFRRAMTSLESIGKQRKERNKQSNKKSKRQRTPRTVTDSASRAFNRRKSITRPLNSSADEIQFRDRYDSSGKQYSVFTAVSRKHLRDGNLNPDLIPPLLFLEECAHLLSLMSAVAFSTLRNDLPEAESPLTMFEPGLPWPLVDPDGYKSRVRKGWTESKSKIYRELQFLIGRSRNDRARTLYNAARPFRVIGNVSDAEIEKLQEARGPLAKVSLVNMWLLELISRECQAGSTGEVGAPIISRLYQFLSDGMAGYNQARKVAYVPFPFPHAQITTVFMLVVDLFVTPLLMTTYVMNFWLGAVLNILSVLCFTGLHEVAREIENPFQNVPNDVPLNNYQAQFNEGLMVMFYGYHPDSFWKNNEYSYDDVSCNNDNDNDNDNNNSNDRNSNKISIPRDQGHNTKKMTSSVTDSSDNRGSEDKKGDKNGHGNTISSQESFSIADSDSRIRVQDECSMLGASVSESEEAKNRNQSLFQVPMGTSFGNSTSVRFLSDNSLNDSIRFDDSSAEATQFRIPGSTAFFHVPHGDLDSSAVFNINSGEEE